MKYGPEASCAEWAFRRTIRLHLRLIDKLIPSGIIKTNFMFCERGTIFLRELFDITKFDLYKEEFAPDCTILILEFIKKQATKTSDKKQAIKTSDNVARIYEYLLQSGEAKTKDIADFLGLSTQRTRVILAMMDDIEVIGANKNRKYRVKMSGRSGEQVQ